MNVRYPGGTSARINDVDIPHIDPYEVADVEGRLAAMPPTSRVADAIRDVLAAIRWASQAEGRGITVTVTRTQEDR